MRPILAVDADPNSNLAEALGVEAGRPLAEIREQGSSPEGSPASGIGRVRAVEDEIPAGHRRGRRLRPDHDGPARGAALLLRREQPAAEIAGQPVAELRGGGGGQRGGHGASSRRTTNNVDYLIAVTDPTLPSLRAAQADRGLVARTAGRDRPAGGVGQPRRAAEGMADRRSPSRPNSTAGRRAAARRPPGRRGGAAGAAGRNVFTLPAGAERSPRCGASSTDCGLLPGRQLRGISLIVS